MVDIITGTNTEKIDALASQVAELRTQVAEMRAELRLYARLLGAAFVLAVPLAVSLLAYLTVQTVTKRPN